MAPNAETQGTDRMPIHRTTPAAYELWVRGAQALSVLESNGCRIDKAYLDTAIIGISKKIVDLEAQIRSDKDFAVWRRRFGDKTKPTSYDQLAAVVFRDLGYKSRKNTASGDRESAAKTSFEGVNIPLVKNFIAAAELRKARDTYLLGIRRELIQHDDDGNWYVHPSYNLNTVITFRSSVQNPNYQNIPKRNPEIAEIVRRCYIPRPGHSITEDDYHQAEVRVACPYTKDPVLMEYVCDTTKDMHYDMACQLFKLKRSQVSKALRNLTKGAYVFATFYGSYYGLTARALWEGIDTAGITLNGSKTTVREHLTAKGFTELGAMDPKEEPVKDTWEAWVRSIDDDFWNNRFKVYAQWKRDWYAAYLRDGGYMMLTGFAVNFPLDKKQVVNGGIQGSSFHCLLWSLINLVDWLKKYNMRTRVIGEIHDSINRDTHPSERDDVFHAARDIMTQRIKKWAPWLNVPLVVEQETSPINGSWAELSGLVEKQGQFLPGAMDSWVKKYGPWENQIVDE